MFLFVGEVYTMEADTNLGSCVCCFRWKFLSELDIRHDSYRASTILR